METDTHPCGRAVLHPATDPLVASHRMIKTDDTLTHFDAEGAARMVDVAGKNLTRRIALASGQITMRPETLALITSGQATKGDVLGVARIAAIQAAKRTSELIPLCHPVALTRVEVTFEVDPVQASVHCTTRAECVGQTGVEMEALTACQIGLLTIYDMCKAVDRGMVMTNVRLVEKRGGASGDWVRPDEIGPGLSPAR